ncbi:MAG: iron-containing alcohol dehydrogenase, partial [Actinophytocola sp.]|nr:iron-containing alcohol dehydrogenase [Actinophytocola sp.]
MPHFETPSETVFTVGAPSLKFGLGAIAEIGEDLHELGVSNVLVITDASVAEHGVPARVATSAQSVGVKAEIFDGVAVEPTDASIADAVKFARARSCDGFVAVGGGSAIDTAKAVNLLTTNTGTLHDYIVTPLGEGRQPQKPTKPLVAVPTTAGTGAEATPICVVDLLDRSLKASISHRSLRPALAVVDPLTTVTMPPAVTAASG